MADSPQIDLFFRGECPDCGVREVRLPAALPNPGDDFDWLVRDYDGFRLFVLEELAARYPERKRWTPADIEVVIVEALATILDQLSDMSDRVAAEAFLETARQPQMVRHLLSFIGYDAVAKAQQKDQIGSALDEQEAVQQLEAFWWDNPHAMQAAKRQGPWQIHTQKRMVTAEDYAVRLREHPMVVHAHAWSEWSGSWFTMYVALITRDNIALDESADYTEALLTEVTNFHEGISVRLVDLTVSPKPTLRMILRPYIDAYRMAGQEVLVQDPLYVGIYLSMSIRVSERFFQSEMVHAISEILGHGPGGFFEPGQLGFGEDIYASDIVEVLMTLDGIEHVCLNRFKRIGGQYPDRAKSGFIPMDGLEVALCNNNRSHPATGYYRLKLHGGLKG
jgi:hypothetical protein